MKFKFILSVILACHPFLAYADPIPRYMEFLEQQLDNMERAIASNESENGPEEQPPFEFSNFFLNVSFYASFDVPPFVNVTIKPEGEFAWEKVMPEDWVRGP